MSMSGLVKENYTPEIQRFEDDKTIFEITPLNGLDAMDMMAELTPGGVMRKALKYGLTDWENGKDKNGEEIKFSQKNIELFLPQTLSDIADKIIEITDLGEPEIKNSESQSK